MLPRTCCLVSVCCDLRVWVWGGFGVLLIWLDYKLLAWCFVGLCVCCSRFDCSLVNCFSGFVVACAFGLCFLLVWVVWWVLVVRMVTLVSVLGVVSVADLLFR